MSLVQVSPKMHLHDHNDVYIASAVAWWKKKKIV